MHTLILLYHSWPLIGQIVFWIVGTPTAILIFYGAARIGLLGLILDILFSSGSGKGGGFGGGKFSGGGSSGDV